MSMISMRCLVIVLASAGAVLMLAPFERCASSAEGQKKDLHGDGLPPGAVARLGTARLRQAGRIRSLAFAPDGKTLVAGSVSSRALDERLVRWDVVSGRRLGGIACDASVRSVEFSPDGHLLAAEVSGSVWLIDVRREEVIWKSAASRIQHVSFSHDGEMLCVTGTGEVSVWDPKKGTKRREFIERGHQPHCAIFLPGSGLLASGGDDATVHVWRVKTGDLVEVLRCGLSENVYSLAVATKGDVLAAGLAGGKVRVWDLHTKESRTIETGDEHTFTVAFSPDGKWLVSAGTGRRVRIWNVSTGELKDTLPQHAAYVRALAFSQDGSHLASGSDDGQIRLWDGESAKERPEFARHGLGSPTWIAFSGDGRTTVTTGQDGLLNRWETSTGRLLGSSQWNDVPSLGYTGQAVFQPVTGSLVFAGLRATDGADYQRCICEVRAAGNGSLVSKDDIPGKSHMFILLAPNGKAIAVATTKYEVVSYDLPKLAEHWRIENRKATSLAYSADSNVVAVGCEDDTVTIVSAATGETLHRIATKDDEEGERLHLYPTGLALSPDKKRLAVVRMDHVVQVRDLEKKVIEHRLSHPGTVTGIAFSPRNQLLATITNNGYVLLWALATGELLAEVRPERKFLSCAVFSPDGDLLAVGSPDDGTALIYEIAKIGLSKR